MGAGWELPDSGLELPGMAEHIAAVPLAGGYGGHPGWRLAAILCTQTQIQLVIDKIDVSRWHEIDRSSAARW